MRHFIKVINNMAFTRDGIEKSTEQIEFIPIANLIKVYRHIDSTNVYIIAYVFYDPERDMKITFYEELPAKCYLMKIQQIERQLCPTLYVPDLQRMRKAEDEDGFI